MISKEIAQMIVDRTMAILPYNINVMDEKGMILGSGDLARRGTVHEAVKYRENIAGNLEVDTYEAEKWNGVAQGINLPIYYQQSTIGIIGITGPPAEVRKYGELVKMSAEMIIEQTYLLDQIQYDERIRREFLHQWLEGTYKNEEELQRRANLLGIMLHLPRVVIYVCPAPGMDTRDQLDQLERRIKSFLQEQELVTVLKDKLVIMKTVTASLHYQETVRNWLDSLQLPPSYIGTPASTAQDMTASYRRSVLTQKTAAYTSLKENIVFYEDLSLEVLLFDLYQTNDAAVHQQQAALSGELIDTLTAYIACNGKTANTAAHLYIHRNTLQYRLASIYRITGKDPKNVKDLFYLYATSVLPHDVKEQND